MPGATLEFDGKTASAAQPYPVSTASVGGKTFEYNPDGTIHRIVGTGGYRTKTFSYNPDGSIAAIAVE